MTSGVGERPYLSIGEVLGLLLEEFPDVTISKIRFLESQGLIEPERTSSGYRKFYDADVERLRVILREQRENFLPLRVIRDRLGGGKTVDAPAPAPRGIRNLRLADADSVAVSDRHPAAQGRLPAPPPVIAPGVRGDMYSRAELCGAASITEQQLGELESYGIVTARGSGANATFTDGDLAIVRAAAGFLLRGIDARHLRGWRQSAERESALYEQRILPLLRQRNPQARQDAIGLLNELADLGADLRAAIVAATLRHHLDH